MDARRIALGSDHAGRALKTEVAAALQEWGLAHVDLGTDGDGPVDYSDYAHAVAEGIGASRFDIGILVCGTGVGMCMAANRHKGVRAVVCSEAYSARMARAHNDANVLCVGARVVGWGVALDIVHAFLNTPFDGGRHQQRVDKIDRGI